tara:strand:- start:24241 stop:25092 length:852 start_codon:yes stop_codon:yes gene_type:complete
MDVVDYVKSDHIALVIIWILAFYATKMSRKFILGFSVFILFWIVYDSMRIIPNYEVSSVHIQEPYQLEKMLFGITYQGSILTLNEYFLIVNNAFSDFLSGFFYLNWMPVPIGFGVYLFYTDKELFLKYSFAFLLVNLIGFTIYYIYPAAPPWYVQNYGFDLHYGIPGNRAGLERFDNLIGVSIFEIIYNKNANVLAAVPSLHSAYPVIVLYYALKKGVNKYVKALLVLFLFGIWFSAVYSSHHFVIDVLAGIIVSIISLIFFEFLMKKNFFKNKLQLFLEVIY